MTTGVYRHPNISEFLRDEKCQVWVRDTSTGEPVYVAVGSAASMRQAADAPWACIVPGCDVPITFAGGPRTRDHYRHLGVCAYRGGGESLDHLAAKAMLADWVSHAYPSTVVAVEYTIKDASTGLHRRPDVHVTFPTGERVAFEVEYKSSSHEAWRTKDTELAAHGDTPVWLVGHTRLRPVEGGDISTAPQGDASTGVDRSPQRVSVTGVATHLAHAGRPVLAVNPHTRQVGTLTDDEDGCYPFSGYRGWVHLDSVDDCVLTGEGIVTPALTRLRAATAEREEHAARERQRQEDAVRALRDAAAARRQPEPEPEEPEPEEQSGWAPVVPAPKQYPKQDVAQLERSARAADRRYHQWVNSGLHAQLTARWSGIPRELAWRSTTDWVIRAHHEYWHAHVYASFVMDRPAGARITLAQVARSVGQFGFTGPTSRLHDTVGEYLNYLATIGVLHTHPDGWVVREQLEALYAPTSDPAPAPPVSIQERRYHLGWEDKRERFIAMNGGKFPDYITCGRPVPRVFTAVTEYWRTIVYLAAVHEPLRRSGRGAAVTVDDIITALHAEGIHAEGKEKTARQAVVDYLHELVGFGYLRHVAEGKYTVTGHLPESITRAAQQRQEQQEQRPAVVQASLF